MRTEEELNQKYANKRTPVPKIPHTHIIHDWEVQEAYRQYKRKYGAEALDYLKHEYSENMPKRNLHFIMGTIAAHPRNFIIIGLLRSTIDPNDATRQQKLF